MNKIDNSMVVDRPSCCHETGVTTFRGHYVPVGHDDHVDAEKIEIYEKFFKPGFVFMSINPLFIEVSLSAELAWDYGVFVSEFEEQNGRFKGVGKYLGVYKKVDGRWKRAALSGNSN